MHIIEYLNKAIFNMKLDPKQTIICQRDKAGVRETKRERESLCAGVIHNIYFLVMLIITVTNPSN